MPPATATVTLDLRVENTYEDGDEIVTRPTGVVVPAPPPEDDTDAYTAWTDNHIRGLTGTGRTDGDAWYDVVVTASTDPALIGREFTFGY